MPTYSAIQGAWDERFVRAPNETYQTGGSQYFNRDHAYLKIRFVSQDANEQLVTAGQRDLEITGGLAERISRLEQATTILESWNTEQEALRRDLAAESVSRGTVDQNELARLQAVAEKIATIRDALSTEFEEKVEKKWKEIQSAISDAQDKLTRFERKLTKLEGGGK